MEHAFQRLATGRPLLRTEFPGLVVLDPPLQPVPVYHYINLKHRALVGPLTEELRRMQESGRFETVRQLVLKRRGTG